MKVSIVIPVYNGANTIAPLVREVSEQLREYDIEFVLVNDSSRDNSEEVCEQLAEKNNNIVSISLRRNFGEHNAVICGLNHISGDCAVIIDDDFQNPPTEIIKLVKELERGFDVVYSRYEQKKHNWYRNAGSRFNDMVATFLLSKPKDLYLSSFKAIRAEVVKEIIKYRGPFPYIDGLLLRVTRSISTVLVEHASRREGRSNYTLQKLISLWLAMFLNFSIKPLRVFTVFGCLVFAAGVVLSIGTAIEKLYDPSIPVGYASIFVALTLLSGIQIMFTGLIGEYLGKQYLDQNGTPQWVIKKKIGGGAN